MAGYRRGKASTTLLRRSERGEVSGIDVRREKKERKSKGRGRRRKGVSGEGFRRARGKRRRTGEQKSNSVNTACCWRENCVEC